ncbi:MAG: hypothetical protein WBD22_03650 [Pyrinomonadaceae bacterium]
MLKIPTLSFVLVMLAMSVQSQRSINVPNGYIETRKIAGRPVHVWAPANPPNMVFDKWVGDTVILKDPFAWHTRVNLMQKNVTLTATFKSAPAWSPTYGQINGRQYGYFFPAGFRGVVFRFHGTGGSGIILYNSLEHRITANDLVAAGFAVVALDSDDRVNRQWPYALPPNNPDIVNVQALINSFISRGFITANTPIFGLGMSNGGAFTAGVSYALNFSAASIYCAPGSAFINQTTVPTIWNMQQNDANDQVGPSGNATAQANSQILAQRGVPTEFNMNIPSPVYPQRFARIPGLSVSDSQIIHDSLKNNGILNMHDYLVQSPSESKWHQFLPAAYTAFSNDIMSELGKSYAGHNFYSENDGRVIAFFNAQLT